MQEHHLGQVVALLNATGIKPVVVKGWSAAQPYAEPGLRPSGDIDLRGRLRNCDKRRRPAGCRSGRLGPG